MALSDLKVKAAKAQAKPYKLTDGRGLYLLVQANGAKLWRFNYRFAGKQKTLALGVYPDVPLATARKKLEKAREQTANGEDPAVTKQAHKAARVAEVVDSFEAVTREWFAKFMADKAKSHSSKIMSRFERDIFPWIGSRPIAQIQPQELLKVLRKTEKRGTLETAHRELQNCGQVFRYGVATGRCPSDPSRDLKGAIAPWRPQHYPTITDPKEIGDLLRAMDGYDGAQITGYALRLAPLLFVRPGELRRAEWNEIDFDKAEWRIPAAKMKARVIHIVPLSTQALVIIRELQKLTGKKKYLFHSVRSAVEPMSENTINAALRRLDYSKEQITGHGFRSMASTILNEQGWNRDAIERQLAHGERNQVRAAYNYAEFMPERRKMMQAWGDYLDTLRETDIAQNN